MKHLLERINVLNRRAIDRGGDSGARWDSQTTQSAICIRDG